jgi:hypothetical protein
MNPDQIKAIQKRIGATVDGFWGRQSIAACQAHLRFLEPSPNPWPSTDEASLTAFYGRPGDESQLDTIEFPIPMYYDGKLVRKTRVHRRCAASLLDILSEIGEKYSGNAEIMRAVQDYGGCYNNRAMRGGTRPSLHARGAAIDLSAGDNGNHTAWPVSATMPIEVMEVFARHGWLSAGAFWGRDAMHFQATR